MKKLQILFFIFFFVLSILKLIYYLHKVITTDYQLPKKASKLVEKSPSYGQTFVNCHLFMDRH